MKLISLVYINHRDCIESLYTRTIKALLSASEMCIPRMPQHCLKTWWNSDLTELKKQSIASHNLWVLNGKPKEGILFSNKNKDKLNYKLKIKKQKRAADTYISDQLHKSLTHKKSKSFWKTWKSNVCKNNSSKVTIESHF